MLVFSSYFNHSVDHFENLSLRDAGCIGDRNGTRTQVFRKNLHYHEVPINTMYFGLSLQI
jgi:hypothetical protein